MAKTEVMYLVTDRDGRVIAAAPQDRASRNEMRSGILPLPGQRVHRVALPTAIGELTRGDQLHAVLSQVLANPDTGRLELQGLELRSVRNEKRPRRRP